MASSTTSPNPLVRVSVFMDGANLFNSVKRRFGYMQPNAEISKLASAVVALKPGRQLTSTFYYIGIPRSEHDAANRVWWNKKLAAMGRTGVKVVSRDLKPRELNIELGGLVSHRSAYTKLVEKGIDLRLGLDLVGRTLDKSFEAAIIFSQDGDLAEAVDDAYNIAKSQGRGISIESAFPSDGGTHRGIRRTAHLPFDKALYDRCIDMFHMPSPFYVR